MGNKQTPTEKRRFLQRITAKLQGAWAWFLDLFSKVDEWIDTVGVQVITFVEGINQAIKQGTPSGNVLDYIVSLIPGELDDQVLAFLREKLPVVLYQLELIVSLDGFNSLTADQQNEHLFDTLRSLSGNDVVRQMYLRQIATELAEQYITQAKVVTPERYQTDTLVSMSFAKLKQAGIV
ncbi:MAG: hypothetical protein H7A09_10610 [Oceanospirillaceae bacterium]|nr:hypothetical protein [Oceanospirillaceae bacterium]